VTGRNPIAVLLQPISGVNVINPLVAFNDIHGGKREVLFFYFVPDTTWDNEYNSLLYKINILDTDTYEYLVQISSWKTCVMESR
jgi:hypothetical protein